MAALKKRKKAIKSRRSPVGKSGSRLRRTSGKASPLDLKRSKHNPIIEPALNEYWESKATFNPTALEHRDLVHIIYRAIGASDISVLGYAKSHDGYRIEKGSKEIAFYSKHKPVIRPREPGKIPPIFYSSGGGWGGGAEDPRLTLLGDIVYMIYTSFDGWGSVRMALTSISLDDFISRRWSWREPVFISPPNEVHKNWALFPEKVGGRYAILHAISPKIMIDYFDSLDELDGSTYIHSIHQGSKMWEARDRLVRGVGPAPIKTRYGWLIIYHKMEPHDSHRYKLWAMILDAKDPTKILYCSKEPILEPDEWYENNGYKGGVVYACGAVVKNGELFVYYGGADKVACVATADLEKFLKELVQSSPVSSRKNKMKVTP